MVRLWHPWTIGGGDDFDVSIEIHEQQLDLELGMPGQHQVAEVREHLGVNLMEIDSYIEMLPVTCLVRSSIGQFSYWST